MKLIILLCSLVVVHGAPASDPDVQLLRYENNNDGLGNYNFLYELSDGTKRREESEVINAGDPDEQLIVRGEYEYLGPDGVLYRVTFIADKDGFHPQGDHLPTLPEEGTITSEPPVLQGFPPAIVASLLGK